VTNLYLIRHGEAVANVTHVVGGMQGDTGLTPLGVAQAERLRDRLAHTGEIVADVLVASSLPRARQTAEILAPALALAVSLDDDLQEIRPGEADGLPMGEAMVRYAVPDFEREPERPLSPGGECFQDLALRVGRALDRIARAHAGRTIVIVTHGGVIDCAFIHFFGLAPTHPPAQLSTNHTSITHWQHRPRWNDTPAWHLIAYNDSIHLRDLDRTVRIPWAELGPRNG